MSDNSFENLVQSSLFSQIIILFALAIAALLLSTFIGTGIASLIFKIDLLSFTEVNIENFNQIYINALKFIQIFVTSATFLVPALVLPKLMKERSFVFLGINQVPTMQIILQILLLLIIMFPFLEWFIQLNMNMKLPEFMKSIEIWMQNKEIQAEQLTMRFLEAPKISDLFINIFAMAIIPAIMEELFFRGLIQNLLKRWFGNIHVAIIVTAIFFSAIHLQFYGFLPRMLLGVILGYLFFWTESIWVSIFAHFLNNSVAIILVYLSQKEIIDFQINQPMNISNLVIIVSFGVSALFLLLLANYYSKRRDKSKDWTKLYTGSSLQEVEIKKNILENNDINSIIINKKDSSITTFGPVELYVDPSDFESAKEIIFENES